LAVNFLPPKFTKAKYSKSPQSAGRASRGTAKDQVERHSGSLVTPTDLFVRPVLKLDLKPLGSP
jgi:hypothetical protein